MKIYDMGPKGLEIIRTIHFVDKLDTNFNP